MEAGQAHEQLMELRQQARRIGDPSQLSCSIFRAMQEEARRVRAIRARHRAEQEEVAAAHLAQVGLLLQRT